MATKENVILTGSERVRPAHRRKQVQRVQPARSCQAAPHQALWQAAAAPRVNGL